MCLIRHGNDPTHIQGHTLDLVISEGFSVPPVNVEDLAPSIFVYLHQNSLREIHH